MKKKDEIMFPFHQICNTTPHSLRGNVKKLIHSVITDIQLLRCHADDDEDL